MYVCEDMLGMLKLMLGAIVLHHTRVTPLLGAAHRPREARGTFKVNNPCPTRRATSPHCDWFQTVDTPPDMRPHVPDVGQALFLGRGVLVVSPDFR